MNEYTWNEKKNNNKKQNKVEEDTVKLKSKKFRKDFIFANSVERQEHDLPTSVNVSEKNRPRSPKSNQLFIVP